MKKWMCLLLALSMLLLAGCSGGAAPAQPEKQAAAETTAPAVADEPYEAVPYSLFPAPEDGYVGDVMPFVSPEGKLEIYYLYDTSHNGQGYHPIYKFITDDLVGYEDKGMALNNGTMADPDPALGTGSVMMDQEGLYHLFYTGHNDSGNNGKGKECVMHAVSTDRENWEKIPGEYFFAPEGYSTDDFRDPEVFWVEEEGCYWMLMAAHHEDFQGVVLKYTSTDLHNWTLQETPLYAPCSYFMLECPNIIKIGDKYYMFYSWDCRTFYAVADELNGPYEAPDDNNLDGGGFIMYAAKAAQLDGKDILCAWHGRAGLSDDSGIYLWAGNVLNHQLVQHADGTLGVCAPEAYNAYFTQEKAVQMAEKAGAVTVNGSSVTLSAEAGEYALVDLGTRPAAMTLECDVTLASDGNVGFAFGGAKGAAYTALCLDAYKEMIHYEGTELEDLWKYDPEGYIFYDFTKSDTHHVKLVCENEIVILYIDDNVALTSRITRSTNGAHIGLFADGCDGSFENITMKVAG